MKRIEAPKYKALYFDLRIKDLEKYYSSTNPKSAYRKIQRFLLTNNFTHEQYSGYHSRVKTTDLDIFDLIKELRENFSWLTKCVSHFEVTNIGANHDLLSIFAETEGPSIVIANPQKD